MDKLSEGLKGGNRLRIELKDWNRIGVVLKGSMNWGIFVSVQ